MGTQLRIRTCLPALQRRALLTRFAQGLNHVTLSETKDFNALRDGMWPKLNAKRHKTERATRRPLFVALKERGVCSIALRASRARRDLSVSRGANFKSGVFHPRNCQPPGHDRLATAVIDTGLCLNSVPIFENLVNHPDAHDQKDTDHRQRDPK